MAVPTRIRLSPSGPFIGDEVGGDLQIGPGSTGLIWRAQGNDPAAAWVEVPNPLAVLPELTQAWSIPRGFHYDVQVRLYLRVLGGQGPAAFSVEAQINAVWTPIANFTPAGAIGWAFNSDHLEGQIDAVHNVNLNLSASTFDVTGMRVLGQAPGESMLYLPQQCMLRVEQYVL
jgi:hypothetical protein